MRIANLQEQRNHGNAGTSSLRCPQTSKTTAANIPTSVITASRLKSCRVLGHSEEKRLIWLKRHPLRPEAPSVSFSLVARSRHSLSTEGAQFLAAMTTDNATPPMATAVAPKSHFQLRPCRWKKDRRHFEDPGVIQTLSDSFVLPGWSPHP